MATANTNHDEWYTTTCGAHQYTLPVRYQDPKAIGNGVSGSVIRATDTETGKYVAIKKMLAPFENPTVAKRTYREFKILTCLSHSDAQVVQLLNVFTPEKNLNEFQTVYFVFNFAEQDLNKLIRRKIPFTEEHIKQIIYSLLRGLKFIHSAGIIHRDIKPPNIGIDEGSNAIILDFGLARPISKDSHTTYVATRWWRAPEVYINQNKYREKLDIWSVGCIMAEMILLRPIFPGSDHIDQLNKIFDILGTPDPSTLNEICPSHVSDYISKFPVKPKQNFSALFGFKYNAASETLISGVSPEGVDLLDRLLSFDPRVRPTAEEALAHPFLDCYHDLEDEPTTKHVFDENDGQEYSVLKWKLIIWQMVEGFRPPAWITDDCDEDS